MKLLRVLFSIIRNKYLLATTAFLVWMLFFDRNDFFVQLDRRQELRELENSRQYFTEQIEQERKLAEELKNNPAVIEKIAREKYFMKRDNEDLFIIQPAQEEN